MLYYLLCSLTPVLDSPLVGAPASGWINSPDSALFPWVPILGAVLFATGFYLQNVHHYILACLRSNDNSDGKDKSRYSIPHGYLFRFVSMPHYLCEMMEYLGLAMFSGFRFSQWSVEARRESLA
jgi:hypothetical protein